MTGEGEKDSENVRMETGRPQTESEGGAREKEKEKRSPEPESKEVRSRGVDRESKRSETARVAGGGVARQEGRRGAESPRKVRRAGGASERVMVGEGEQVGKESKEGERTREERETGAEDIIPGEEWEKIRHQWRRPEDFLHHPSYRHEFPNFPPRIRARKKSTGERSRARSVEVERRRGGGNCPVRRWRQLSLKTNRSHGWYPLYLTPR